MHCEPRPLAFQSSKKIKVRSDEPQVVSGDGRIPPKGGPREASTTPGIA